jgi:NDP-sugar pyrophosphorylase family protein
MMSELTLVLLAAGMGSRYGGLKQLDGFGPAGETLMDYGVFDAKRAGFTRVIFVIRKDFEAEFRERVLSRYDGHIKVDLAFQSLDALPGRRPLPEGRTKPWGTCQALLSAMPLLDGPFCVCNADDFYGRDAYAHMAAFLRGAGPEDGALVGFDLAATLSEHGTVSRGICKVEGGQLRSVTEQTKLKREADKVVDLASGLSFDLHSLCSMNFWGFQPGVLAHFQAHFWGFLQALKDPLNDEFYLPLAVDLAAHAGQLKVSALSGGTRWFGVTYPEDKASVQNALRSLVASGDYPSPLFKS